MRKKTNCPGCIAERHKDLKLVSRYEHTCDSYRVTMPLKNMAGSATFPSPPDQATIDAVNAMAELAFKNLKK